jgi:hypothetical protein
MQKEMDKSYEERLELAENEFETACEFHDEAIGIFGMIKESILGDGGWRYNAWYEIRSKYGV